MAATVVVGGTLFRVALEQLGDATQWVRIARRNGLSDPVLDGLVTLVLPDRDPQAGGGIARQ